MHDAATDAVMRAVATGPEVESPGNIIVGLSGGLDSTVLLHALAAAHPGKVRTIHVHHGLHADADAWAHHCQRICAALDVPLMVERVRVVDVDAGPEAAARHARHAAFKAHLRDGEWLALAHHRDDQAETFLLRALRASGPDGLAAMRVKRDFGRGWMWRPLLGIARETLRTYADTHALAWIDDPSNASIDFDRNYLRHEVMPLLRARWPQVDAAFAQSAKLSQEAHELLASSDEAELARARMGSDRVLQIDVLLQMSPPLRARVLRRWVRSLGLPPLPASALDHIERDVLHSASDRNAVYDWHLSRIERSRGLLHASARGPAFPVGWARMWNGVEPLHLPGGGMLSLQGGLGFKRPVFVRPRLGGERIDLPFRTHSTSLKKHLQDIDMPVWQRRQLPLLVDPESGTVLSAGDRIQSRHLWHWFEHGDSPCLRWQLA